MGVQVGKPRNPVAKGAKAVRRPVKHRAAPKHQPEARKMPVAAVAPVLPLPPPPPPPPEGGVRLVDIEHGQCRFPIGDPKDASFRFCGADTGRTYCAVHHRIVYVPTARQIARRAA